MGNLQGSIALDELYLQENGVAFSGIGNVTCQHSPGGYRQLDSSVSSPMAPEI